jgi:hypothetical protein
VPPRAHRAADIDGRHRGCRRRAQPLGPLVGLSEPWRIAAGEPLDELTCGLSVVLPVDDDGLDEVGGLVDALAGDDELCAG